MVSSPHASLQPMPRPGAAGAERWRGPGPLHYLWGLALLTRPRAQGSPRQPPGPGDPDDLPDLPREFKLQDILKQIWAHHPKDGCTYKRLEGYLISQGYEVYRPELEVGGVGALHARRLPSDVKHT